MIVKARDHGSNERVAGHRGKHGSLVADLSMSTNYVPQMQKHTLVTHMFNLLQPDDCKK